MTEFTYFRGEWKETDTLPEHLDGEENRDWLLRCGFNPVPTQFGDEYGSNIEIYFKSRTSFLATVAISDYYYNVLLPDFPSLMMFIRDFAPAFLLAETCAIQEEMKSALETISEQ